MKRLSLALGAVLTMGACIMACGEKDPVDPNFEGGSDAVPAAPHEVPPLSGAVLLSDGRWRLRVVSWPMTCQNSLAGHPAECGWWEVEILLAVDELYEGLVVTPESGLGWHYFLRADDEPASLDCAYTSTTGALLDDVTIVNFHGGTVLLELGPGWGAAAAGLASSPAGAQPLWDCLP